jgi:hypothetical protein
LASSLRPLARRGASLCGLFDTRCGLHSGAFAWCARHGAQRHDRRWHSAEAAMAPGKEAGSGQPLPAMRSAVSLGGPSPGEPQGPGSGQPQRPRLGSPPASASRRTHGAETREPLSHMPLGTARRPEPSPSRARPSRLVQRGPAIASRSCEGKGRPMKLNAVCISSWIHEVVTFLQICGSVATL